MNTSEVDPRTIGRINAAMISAGIGCVALALLVVLAEISAGAKDFMNLNDGVGALSGKTVFAVLIWLVFWVMLDRGTSLSKMSFEKAFRLMLILVAIGLIGTFPIFFQAFAAG